MQLPAVVGDTLAALGAAVASVSIGAFILKLLLGMLFFAMVLPYVLELSAWLGRAFARETVGESERKMALNALRERQLAQGEASTIVQPSPDPDHAAAERAFLPPPRAVRAGGGAGGGGVPEQQPPPSLSPPEIVPLTTLRELLDYERPGWGQGFAPARPPFVAPPFPPLRNRLLVCHDFAGGYGEDRLVQGGGYDRAYRMYDWGLIDVFVYFSHNLVTIPTAGWTDVAHRHGTRVLGTFITEWDAGRDVCAEFLRSDRTAERAATKLTEIAAHHGFDGWLVNIENRVDPGANVDRLVFFLKSLTMQMRAAKRLEADRQGTRPSSSSSSSSHPSGSAAASTVLWYDSVTVEGKLKWQDRLNAKNRVFFDACDGIFVNYTWKADYPSASALEAEARRYDVYMGVDTFGRGTWGGGGFDTDKALGKIRRAGVSAALFAPAWTMENQTAGGGRVAPGLEHGWGEVERAFGDVDAEFWAKVAAAWQPARPVPGPCAALPVVVNFGRGVGDTWRIRGREVAVFCTSPSGGTAAVHGVEEEEEEEVATAGEHGLVGGAFYDLMSQCLTPLVGGRGAAGQRDDTVLARRAGDPNASPGGVNGTVGARYSFEESYDGGSSLRFTGVLNEKAIATFPLFSCDVPLPARPLEVRVTFCANADSEIALVLLLDVQGQLGGRQEVVLRGWGAEGTPTKRPVFSKRLSMSDSKAAYSPVQEEHSSGESLGSASGQGNLQAQVRALREAGESHNSIGSRLRAERDSRGGSRGSRGSGGEGGAGGSGTASTGAPAWTTRKYVIRDLRMGGSRAVREIRMVCARRRGAAAAKEGGASGASASAGRRLVDGDVVGRAGGGLRGVAGLAAFRACLGEVAIGPWRDETPCTFGKLEGLRALEVACMKGKGDGEVVVDLSLEWEAEWHVGGGNGACRGGDVGDAGRPWATLHCDLWRASEDEEGGWRWLGRAYGRKYRLRRLRVGGCGQGGTLLLAVQQVNAMGYREVGRERAGRSE